MRWKAHVFRWLGPVLINICSVWLAVTAGELYRHPGVQNCLALILPLGGVVYSAGLWWDATQTICHNDPHPRNPLLTAGFVLWLSGSVLPSAYEGDCYPVLVLGGIMTLCGLFSLVFGFAVWMKSLRTKTP